MPNQPKTPARTIRLDDATWVALRELADQDGRTISDLVREAIATYLDTPN